MFNKEIFFSDKTFKLPIHFLNNKTFLIAPHFFSESINDASTTASKDLGDEPVRKIILKNLPNVKDIETMIKLLESIGSIMEAVGHIIS